MKKKVLLGVIVLIVSSIFVNAQTYHLPKTTEIATLLQNQNAEVQIRFFVESKNKVNYFSRKYSVDKVKQWSENSFEVRAYLNNSDLQKMLNEQVSFQIKDPDPATKAFTMATTVAQMSTWDKYPTYSVYLQMMAQFQTTYPSLCKIDTIMASTLGGHKILVAKISKNVNLNEDEPEFLYSSTMHGDETTGAMFILRLIDYLLSNYTTNTRVANLLNNMEIYICPFANPDGTYKTSNNTIGSSPTSTRANYNNIDLNRNYPDPWTGTNPDGNATQPETQAFMNFAAAHNFVMGANFHGGAELTNYPWDYYTTSERAQPDANWWINVCKEYVDTCKSSASNNGYMTEQAYTGAYPGVTEGADWYSVTGGRQDYMGYFHRCREVTIEVSTTKTLGTENLNTYWNYNYKSLLQYMEQALYGIRGVVTDANTGLPIKARVFVNNHDADSTDVYTSMPIGNYHRPIKGGTYSVTYSAPCYKSQTYTITVADKQSVRQNVQLIPGVEATFGASDTLTCENTIAFINTTDSALTGNTWSWNFGDGNTSTLASPIHTYASDGVYTVKLVTTNSCGHDTTIRTNYIHIQSPSVPSVVNGSTCNPGPVSLSASASGTIRWYNQSTGGTLLATGNSYTTPSISSTQTYYVENWDVADSITGGDSRVNSGGGFYNSGSEYGLYFDAISPFKLLSVLVNANSAASRTFKLYNASGTVIQQKTITLATGQTRVYLNFDVPQGTGFKITANTNPNLYRNNVTASYPYQIGNLAIITGSNAPTNPASVYYFFYDWHIQEVGCVSNRVPIVASVNTGTAPGNAGTITGNATVCQNQTNIIYTVPAIANATSYVWTLPSGATGTSTTSSISVNFGVSATSGNITVKGTNLCGDGVISTKAITVNALPAAAGTISGNATVCLGDNSVTYTIPTIANATSYVWTLPSGATGTSTTSSISVNFGASATSGNITVKGSNLCGDGVISTKAITVNALPATAGTISGNTTVCQGENSVTYTVPAIANATSYEWTLPSGYTGSSSSNTITISINSTALSGAISVKGVNGCGSGLESLKNITVNQMPQETSIIGLNHVCPDQSNVTYYTPKWNYATSYQWVIPVEVTVVGLSNDTTITLNFPNNAQPCNIGVKAINDCGTSDSISFFISIDALPNASFTTVSNATNVSFTNTSANATSYAWDFGDATYSSEQNPTHSYLIEGHYVAQLIAFNECSSDTTTQDFTLIGGAISQNIDPVSFSVFPNPTNNSVTVKSIGQSSSNNSYSISNNIGQIVMHGVLESNFTQINIQDLPIGCYYLKINQIHKPFKIIKN